MDMQKESSAEVKDHRPLQASLPPKAQGSMADMCVQ